MENRFHVKALGLVDAIKPATACSEDCDCMQCRFKAVEWLLSCVVEDAVCPLADNRCPRTTEALGLLRQGLEAIDRAKELAAPAANFEPYDRKAVGNATEAAATALLEGCELLLDLRPTLD